MALLNVAWILAVGSTDRSIAPHRTDGAATADRMYVYYNEWYVRVRCPSCDSLVYSHDAHTVQSPPTPPIVTEPAVPRDVLREVKKKIATKNKALRAARAKVTEVYAGFKGQATPLLTALKEMRSEAVKQVRQSAEWRAYYRWSFIADKAVKTVMNTYHLSRNQMIEYKLKFSYRRRRNACDCLRRKFRIRIG